MKTKALFIILSAVLFSCKKKHECLVTVKSDPDGVLSGVVDDNNVAIDTLDCNCLNKTIKEIENNLDYSIDSLEGRDANVEYLIDCD